MNNRLLPFAALAAAALIAGCAEERPAAEIVTERAQQRWDALVEGDWQAAYAFYAPGYRQTTSAEDFGQDMRTRSVRWTGAEVESAECEETRCEVRTLVTYEVPSAPAQMSGMGNTRPVDETWIRVDGRWWYSG
ncbi:MAG: hypothetical protein R3323_06465 [Wenzhouxiangellaceae bacterium]|nr:hypothetical protein [Wenzhouxiangellaceae bacterium]